MIATATQPVKRAKKLVKKRKSTKTSTVDYSSASESDHIEQVSNDNRRMSSEDEAEAVEDVDSSNEEPQTKRAAIGLANALAKVLKTEKPKNKKHTFLSKSKKINEQKEENETKISFEIDGEIKEEKPTKTALDLDISLGAKQNKSLALRMKPSFMDREREKAFKKVATKGVVQLFNAVRAQQKDLVQKLEDAGPLDHRKDAVLNSINKKKFLDVLMGGSRAKSEVVDNAVKDEVKEESDDDGYTATDRPDQSKSQWDVLRNDFMTNKKMTHWDKDDEDEDDKQMDTDNASDSDE